MPQKAGDFEWRKRRTQHEMAQERERHLLMRRLEGETETSEQRKKRLNLSRQYSRKYYRGEFT